ncbi:hypothetical protein [Cupriavidus sp. RAF12]|uniref:hypothetical protein n=1 Tax=Cupriavidus sp. RAF12 TaxID=3233050 RepID=UPI003F8E5A52
MAVSSMNITVRVSTVEHPQSQFQCRYVRSHAAAIMAVRTTPMACRGRAAMGSGFEILAMRGLRGTRARVHENMRWLWDRAAEKQAEERAGKRTQKRAAKQKGQPRTVGL